jgi:hypothetical protein
MNGLKIPAFASGGPVLDVAGPSHVFAAARVTSQDESGAGDQSLALQVRELIDVVKQVVGPIKVDSNKSRKLLEKFDALGFPTKAAKTGVAA